MDITKLARGGAAGQSWQSVYLIGTWLSTTIISLSFASLFLIYISSDRRTLPITTTYQLYQALPANQLQVSETIESKDARAKIVENFFQSYNSALASYSELFILVADKYQLDYRLLPAIAMQESNGGKKMPTSSFNPFGFGIYGSRSIKFDSFEDAIETVGRALREDYLNEGLITPERMMVKYTPPSVSKGGPWANGVRSFMAELR